MTWSLSRTRSRLQPRLPLTHDHRSYGSSSQTFGSDYSLHHAQIIGKRSWDEFDSSCSPLPCAREDRFYAGQGEMFLIPNAPWKRLKYMKSLGMRHPLRRYRWIEDQRASSMHASQTTLNFTSVLSNEGATSASSPEAYVSSSYLQHHC